MGSQRKASSLGFLWYVRTFNFKPLCLVENSSWGWCLIATLIIEILLERKAEWMVGRAWNTFKKHERLMTHDDWCKNRRHVGGSVISVGLTAVPVVNPSNLADLHSKLMLGSQEQFKPTEPFLFLITISSGNLKVAKDIWRAELNWTVLKMTTYLESFNITEWNRNGLNVSLCANTSYWCFSEIHTFTLSESYETICTSLQ